MKRSGDLPAGIAIIRAAQITVWSSTLTAEQVRSARIIAAALVARGPVVLTMNELKFIERTA